MIIDFETHFFTRACIDYLVKQKVTPNLVAAGDGYNMCFTDTVSLFHSQSLLAELCDIGEGRIAVMDKAGVTVQILSLTTANGVDSGPGDEAVSTSLARETNDLLHAAIQKNPTRFRGFASISPYDVDAAVKELERAINKLDFVGWLTHSNFGVNNYLDDKNYWPLLEAAESLDIPIYLHPAAPLMKEFGKYGFTLAGSAMGFEFDTALCLMRMILGGVFDQFPKLKIILGHLGETMPFLMERLDHLFRVPEFKRNRQELKRIPSEVLKQNVYITTSGRFFTPALNYAIEAMGEDRMLFASDYPMESLQESVDFVKNAGLSQTVRDKIYFENAKRLGFYK